MLNTCDVADLIADHFDKLKSILARRGGDWGFTGNVTEAQCRDFAQIIADHVANATETWQASYRGSDRLFHLIGDRTVVTLLDGTFESTWRATTDQLAHYRPIGSLPDRDTNQMIGIHPTVGCLILLEKTSYSGLEKVIQTLQMLIPIHEWRCSKAGPSPGQATLGGSLHPMIAMAQETGETVSVHLEFDEEEVATLSRETSLSIEQLFLPYVQAAKTLPGVVAVGVGFELSPPKDLREEALREAGVAVLFARDADHKTWSRREALPLVGHPA